DSLCGQVFVNGCTNGDLKLWDVDISLLHAEKDAHDLGVTCCSSAPHLRPVEPAELGGAVRRIQPISVPHDRVGCCPEWDRDRHRDHAAGLSCDGTVDTQRDKLQLKPRGLVFCGTSGARGLVGHELNHGVH
ncbi:unnamed protein product, partial [Pleuronectes platessa]